jgi:hypothetical protein
MINKNCTVEGCERKFLAKGLCNTHYKQEYRAGNLDIRPSHGMYKTPTYASWQCMKDRCHRKSNAAYKYYGGRGVEVCREWRESFVAFLGDMGE